MALYHRTVDFISDSWSNQRTQLPLLAITGASFTLGLLLRSLLIPGEHRETVLLSPRTKLLPSLSEDENRNLALPNDVLPGGRDVASPYGSIRVYEWGREDGPKVLLVHGITTPCISLGGLAHALVDRGCRVMIFDLFGRGYSDCPADLPQDDRLFATQIMLALTSSSISWTGADSGKFCLAGYSLGGGIAAGFASYFPHLLSSLVLLAPSGLIRNSHISSQSRLLYSRGLMPENLLGFLVSRRLRAGPLIRPTINKGKLNTADALTEELPSQGAAEVQVLSREYPGVNVPAAVTWQANHHSGFIHAFMSSMRHGPILRQRQWNTWARLGEYLSAQNNTSSAEQNKGLPNDKVHILCGNSDTIIIKGELVTDATAVLGGNAVFKFYDAGHEFPSTKYDEVAAYIWKLL
ncbi:Alpha/beta hydrolase family protein [Penicillium capsulatum]|uniref:Alpha/beta hydrolase family protein n=1 Tax=Penicillium capsulatum TaxID=69766 RepID=A0A9W9LGN1_9EURO|nr:Alpha/beta hydrolase family protein [Penicillium capsulatum]KAJ6106615.1 Alpha/beta hydrolase family protein [Penicillium capsulatum]